MLTEKTVQELAQILGKKLTNAGLVATTAESCTGGAMAIGAVKNSDADIAVAISGIAGPDGGSDEKPVGTVCIAWYNAHSGHKTESYLFVGDRSAVRKQAIRLALLGLIENVDALGSV